MSASALRYSPRPDRNAALRQKIIDLAHRHRRYGVGMIHLKLSQDGEKANYKRVERLGSEPDGPARTRGHVRQTNAPILASSSNCFALRFTSLFLQFFAATWPSPVLPRSANEKY